MDIDILEKIEYTKEGILSKDIMNKSGLDISLFCMAKNTSISDHTSAKKAIVYVIEGDGIFNLKGKDILMKPGKIICMDKNALHNLKAKENTSFLLVLFPYINK
ncbi:MAG: cupin domain-containing protein [Nanoarchaeota archaeon]|nr:cupin domain-containing protein [Nanoarchaeota archaeon]